jgi:eukaryotic-like serine/threonine-protein kinase
LLDRSREIWQSRGELMTPIPGRPASELEHRIRTDLIDIITVWADVRVRVAPAGEEEEARREALAWLDQAAGTIGSGPSLERLRRSYAKAIGRSTSIVGVATGELQPRTAWEHCDLGRAYLREDDYPRAAQEFQRAVDLRPQDFWSNFYQGLCAFKLGRFDEALNAFRVCIAVADNPAECYFNRALAYEALGKNDEALCDYTRALECDDHLAGAALNRGILHYAAGRYSAADTDLGRALAAASGRQARGVILFNRALVSLARNDQPAAVADLKAAIECGHAEALKLSVRLQP